jgi:EpsI family protein
MTSTMNITANRSIFAPIRILVIAAIVLAVSLGAKYMNDILKPPEVERPAWTFRDLPRQLGNWQGEDTEMDPTISMATGAQIIVDRMYQDVSSHNIKMHTAFFDDPSVGVYHNPMNCYRANGWKLKNESRERVQIAENKTLEVSFTTWELNNDRVYVVYWYQLGEYSLYGRGDLGFKIRWALRGQPVWPVLMKVMLQIPVPSETDESKEVVLDFAKQVAAWMNKQEELCEAKGGVNRTIRDDVSAPQKTD